MVAVNAEVPFDQSDDFESIANHLLLYLISNLVRHR